MLRFSPDSTALKLINLVHIQKSELLLELFKIHDCCWVAHIVSIFAGNCCLALNLTSKLIVNPFLQIAKNMQEIILIWLVINRAENCILTQPPCTLLWRWQCNTWILERLQGKTEVFFSACDTMRRTNATRNTWMTLLFAQSLSPIKCPVLLDCVP